MGYFGSSELAGVKVGSSDVSKIYVGSSLAWEASPSSAFKLLTYTGNGAARSITGAGFEPGLVWINKTSSSSKRDMIFDVTRGPTKLVTLNYASAENTNVNSLTSFDADGFSLGTEYDTNQSGVVYRAFCWGGLGPAATNNDGTTATNVRVSAGTGFSVFTYTGNSVSNTTIGHGLGSTPDFVLIQYRFPNLSYLNRVYAPSVSTGNQVWTIAYQSALTTGSSAILAVGPNTITLSSNGSVNGTNGGGLSYVGYAFKSVPGVSKFGVVTDDGSGVVNVDCGFMPQFLLLKAYNVFQNWYVCTPTGGTTGYVTFTTPPTDQASNVSSNIAITGTGFSLDPGAPGNVSGGTSSLFYMAYG